MPTRLPIAAAAAAVITITACDPGPSPVFGDPGTPLPDLTPDELQRFSEGQTLFNHGFTPEEGLGPLFNQDRCSSCHDLPTSGGTGVEFADKATRFSDLGCDLLENEGGDNIQQRTTPLLRALGVFNEPSPRSATARVRVMPPSLYGSGLIEAIPDEVLAAWADSADTDGDGISGRLGRNAAGGVARFGRKADFSTVAAFVEEAFLAEMGLTTAGHPEELRLGGEQIPRETDPAAEPEISAEQLDRVVDYVRFLQPPSPEEPRNDAVRDTLERGERLFHSVGCADCHRPEMTAGMSESAAITRRTIRLYSDLLLHDLGPEMAGVCGRAAGPSEYRTARLLGARFRDTFLHDGRAHTVRDAVMFHGGEASTARAAFVALREADRAALVRFVASR